MKRYFVFLMLAVSSFSPLTASCLGMAENCFSLSGDEKPNDVKKTISYQSAVDELMHASPLIQLVLDQAAVEEQAIRSGSFFDDPEVSAAYFWGDPSAIGRRWDLSVSQSLDFPSVYIHKSRLRDLQSEVSNGKARVRLQELVGELQQLFSDLVYQNALVAHLSDCHERMERMALLFQRRMEVGDCGVLEYNRSQFELAQVDNRLRQAEADRDYLLGTLQTWAGNGRPVVFVQDSWPVDTNFETGACGRYCRNFIAGGPDSDSLTGLVAQLSQEYRKDSLQVVVARQQWLPKFEVGYASENVVGETFRGVTVGLSIPLWTHGRQVASARSQAVLSQQTLQTEIQRQQSLYVSLRKKAALLAANVRSLQQSFMQFDSQNLLLKALEAGEISLESYLTQTDFYNDAKLELLQAQHQLDQVRLQIEALDEL